MKEWKEFVEHLARQVQEQGYNLVVLDAISTFWPVTDENNAAAVGEAVVALRQVANAGAAVLLVHHPRKGDGEDEVSTRGSGALPAEVDVMIHMRKSKKGGPKQRVLTATGRHDDETPGSLVIELTDAGYVCLGTASEAREDSEADHVRQVLPAGPPGLTVDEICQELHARGRGESKSDKTVRKSLKGGEGRWCETTGKGTRNDPFRYHLAGGLKRAET